MEALPARFWRRMPKKKNLDLADALGEDVDVTEEEANDAAQLVPKAEAVVPVPVVAPTQSLSLTVADLQALVATAVSAAQQGNQALADVVTQGIAQARKPIPEGTDASNPRVSVYNPLGDRDHPRPLLKCEFFMGTQDHKTKQVSRTYPFLDNDLSVYEVIALNTVQPGEGKIALYDGTVINVSVRPEYNEATDALRRLVFVLPSHVTEKKSAIKNMLPNICSLVAQYSGHQDYSKLSKDDLAWFMAEHRALRYVAVREAVAA